GVGRVGGHRGVGHALGVGAVGAEVPGGAVVGEHDVDDAAEAGAGRGIVDGDGGLDAGGEVAVHPVGGGDEPVALGGVFLAAAEDVDAGVVEGATVDC